MIFNKLEEKRKRYGTSSLALIDPDRKNDHKMDLILNNINKSDFDAILVGGSYIDDTFFDKRIEYIKKNTNLPVIIFPGDSTQISKFADAILFTSLISGRNPKYLIEEQVKASKKIYDYKIEAIPTAYILFKTNTISAVEKISKTKPIDMNNKDEIISHVLAAQFMGNKFLFLEAGSNSNISIPFNVVKYIFKTSSLPLIVGGGIKDPDTARSLSKSGAGYIVIGSLIEESENHNLLLEINQSIKNCNE